MWTEGGRRERVGSLDSITLLMTVSPDSEISVSTPMNKL
jgi:hypothetical protein